MPNSHQVCVQPPGTGFRLKAGMTDCWTASRSIHGVVKTKWYKSNQQNPFTDDETNVR